MVWVQKGCWFILVAISFLYAQICGTVTNAQNGKPVSEALVFWKNSGVQARTDSIGRFVLDYPVSARQKMIYRLDYRGGILQIPDGYFSLPVSVDVINLDGSRRRIVHNQVPYNGLSLNIRPYINKQMVHVIEVSSGNERRIMMRRNLLARAVSLNIPDTLIVFKNFYDSLKIGGVKNGDSLMLALKPKMVQKVRIMLGMEDYCSYDGVAETKYAGYQSIQPLNLVNALKSGYSLALRVTQDAQIDLTVAYANGGNAARPMELWVDNQLATEFSFERTDGWDHWVAETRPIRLVSGNHLLSWRAKTAEGGPNIDWSGTNSDIVERGLCPTMSSVSQSSISSGWSSIAVSSSSAQTISSSSFSGPVGFAAMNGGTTGGGNVTPTVVKTLAEFKSAVQDNKPRVVIVSGTIRTTDGDGYAIEIKSDKTIRGVDKNAKIYGGLLIKNARNVIVQNLNIQGVWPNSGPDDALAVRNSQNVWLDHLNIWDAGDGNLDITNQSSYVTVSWCKFWYTNSSHPHRLNSLIGSGGGDHPEDWGYLKVTFHHNWFADLVDQRMPRIMYGQAHVFNNYYTASGNSYCVGVGSYGALLVENNYFKGVKDPHIFMYDIYMWITARGNIYDNTTGKKDSGKGGTRYVSGQNFEVMEFSKPPYSYIADEASRVPELVTRGAGPQ